MSDGDSSGRIDRRELLKRAGAAGSVGLAGLAGCAGGGGGGGGGGDETDTPTSTPMETTTTGGTSGEDTVKIGSLHPLTGPYGGLATLQQNGMKLAVKRINENGGINGRTVEAVFEDTQLDPQTGKQKARKLVEQDNVDVLYGAISSSVGAVIHEFAAEQNVPYLLATAANSMTMKNCKPTTFRYEYRASQTATGVAGWAVDRFGTNIWTHNADYLWGNSVAKALRQQAKKVDSSVNIVGQTKSELGATDFSSYVSQIAASDADWVWTGLNGGDAVNFLKQAASYGLKGSVDIVSPTNSFQFIRKAAGDAAVGTYSSIRYYENFDTEANQAFVDRFSNEFGKPPDNFAHVSWSMALHYAKAARQAGSVATADIIPALEEVSMKGPMGPVNYRKCDHQAKRPTAVGEIISPGNYDWPDLEVQNQVSADNAIVPCDQTGCSF